VRGDAGGRQQQSPDRAVQRHVADVYLKIGAYNKADATADALRHRLDRAACPRRPCRTAPHMACASTADFGA
jgi:hypothetical protein